MQDSAAMEAELGIQGQEPMQQQHQQQQQQAKQPDPSVRARVRLPHLARMIGQTVTFAGQVTRIELGAQPVVILEAPGGGEVQVIAQQYVRAQVGDIIELPVRVQTERSVYQEGPETQLGRDTDLRLLAQIIDMTHAPGLASVFPPPVFAN